MRVITQGAENYIRSLAACIGRDPASLETWRCLHIQAKEGAGGAAESLLESLKGEFKDADCDVVLCRDRDILLIGEAPDLDILYQLQARLSGEMEESLQPDVALYDLFYGWREIRKILLAKADEDAAIPLPDDSADFGEIFSLSETFEAARKLRHSRNPLHVLLVEDDDLTRRFVTGMFKQNYAMITARDAKEAIANYLLHAPDIVFLDINLPDRNGFQVLKAITDSDPEAYVVMFSGNHYLDNVTHALNAGASGFVAKPFSRDKMRHYIEDCALSRRSQGHA